MKWCKRSTRDLFCLETRWLGQNRGFYLPERHCNSNSNPSIEISPPVFLFVFAHESAAQRVISVTIFTFVCHPLEFRKTTFRTRHARSANYLHWQSKQLGFSKGWVRCSRLPLAFSIEGDKVGVQVLVRLLTHPSYSRICPSWEQTLCNMYCIIYYILHKWREREKFFNRVNHTHANIHPSADLKKITYLSQREGLPGWP